MVLLLLLLLYISTYIQMQRIPEHTYCLCHTSTIHTSYIYRYSQIARIQRLAIHAPRGTSSSRTFARDIRRLNPRPQHAAAIDCWRPCVAGCARRLCVCVCVVVCACAWGFICAYVYREKEQKREYMEKERERESMPPPLIAGVVRPPIVPADCVCVCVYIYIYVCVCVCVCIYIYMYIQRILIARVAAASSIVPSRFIISLCMYI